MRAPHCVSIHDGVFKLNFPPLLDNMPVDYRDFPFSFSQCHLRASPLPQEQPTQWTPGCSATWYLGTYLSAPTWVQALLCSQVPIPAGASLVDQSSIRYCPCGHYRYHRARRPSYFPGGTYVAVQDLGTTTWRAVYSHRANVVLPHDKSEPCVGTSLPTLYAGTS